tara:strand:+ start:280 stop:465 length:186 start_codon:yes stop_codon:yes gene_type:complete
MAARKKKVFMVERKTNSGKDGMWVRMKGQFITKADAQEWIDSRDDGIQSDVEYRIGKEDKV